MYCLYCYYLFRNPTFIDLAFNTHPQRLLVLLYLCILTKKHNIKFNLKYPPNLGTFLKYFISFSPKNEGYILKIIRKLSAGSINCCKKMDLLKYLIKTNNMY